MTRRAHEHALDLGGRHVVGVVVPADVLAGHLVAVAARRHLVEDLAGARDVVAEVVALDHVLAPPAGDRAKRRVPAQCLPPGACPGLVGQGHELLLGCRAERVRAPAEGRRGSGHDPDRARDEGDGDDQPEPRRAGPVGSVARHGPGRTEALDRSGGTRWGRRSGAIRHDRTVVSRSDPVSPRDGPGRGGTGVPVSAGGGGREWSTRRRPSPWAFDRSARSGAP